MSLKINGKMYTKKQAIDAINKFGDYSKMRVLYHPAENKHYYMEGNVPYTGTLESIALMAGESWEKHSILFTLDLQYFNVALHNHEYFEFVYAYRGSLVTEIDGEKVAMEEGDICILNKDAYHSLQADQGDNILVSGAINDEFRKEIVGLLPEEHGLQRFFRNHKGGKNYRFFPSRKYKRIKNTAQVIVEEFILGEEGYELSVKGLFMILMRELLKVYHLDAEHRDIEREGAKNDIEDILEYISNHYNVVTIKMVANYFHFNPNYLSKLIKKQTGESFTEILQKIKINKARAMLEFTDKSVESIAEEVGYNSASHFHRIFKQQKKSTPEEYRKRIRELHI